MFEWGIFLLEAQVKRFAWAGLDITKQFARVEYDWPKKELVYRRYQSLQKARHRQVCGSLISQMTLPRKRPEPARNGA
jgi:hypothetical protein